MEIQTASVARSAFTLIELVIVVLIIAILVALIGTAAFKAMGMIPQVQTSTDIAQLSLGVRNFMMDFNLDSPPPSRLVLNENVGNFFTFYPPYVVGDPNYTFLQKMFGKTLAGTGCQPGTTLPLLPWLPPVPPNWVDWNGDGIPNGPWVLEGEQCLIFFVGGVPTNPNLASSLTPFVPQGFATNNVALR